MLKGFREFIMRGNAIDLAVGVVIGAAFGAVVNSLVKDLITPLISAIAKLPDFSELAFTLNGSTITYGNLLNAAISFLLMAVAIYFFIVLPMNKLTSRFTKPPAPTSKDCSECLSKVPIAAKRCANCTQPLAS
ncbi:MAG TPA: large conductance mechanosensitive channel protein MscL [Candidatus Doudnabacteria bacterium]|nr:large conductance mechanosensitive channel protein MscL [Candidatus Doudnabacteria bacterium]